MNAIGLAKLAGWLIVLGLAWLAIDAVTGQLKAQVR